MDGQWQVTALQAHVATLKGRLRGRPKRKVDKSASDLAAEQARTTQAIAAFEQLAQKLEAITEAKRPPWWRLLLRRAG